MVRSDPNDSRRAKGARTEPRGSTGVALERACWAMWFSLWNSESLALRPLLRSKPTTSARRLSFAIGSSVTLTCEENVRVCHRRPDMRESAVVQTERIALQITTKVARPCYSSRIEWSNQWNADANPLVLGDQLGRVPTRWACRATAERHQQHCRNQWRVNSHTGFAAQSTRLTDPARRAGFAWSRLVRLGHAGQCRIGAMRLPAK